MNHTVPKMNKCGKFKFIITRWIHLISTQFCETIYSEDTFYSKIQDTEQLIVVKYRLKKTVDHNRYQLITTLSEDIPF